MASRFSAARPDNASPLPAPAPRHDDFPAGFGPDQTLCAVGGEHAAEAAAACVVCERAICSACAAGAAEGSGSFVGDAATRIWYCGKHDFVVRPRFATQILAKV
jgi:hypothetical protein